MEYTYLLVRNLIGQCESAMVQSLVQPCCWLVLQPEALHSPSQSCMTYGKKTITL
jgi:hypothetical protein